MVLDVVTIRLGYSTSSIGKLTINDECVLELTRSDGSISLGTFDKGRLTRDQKRTGQYGNCGI